MLKKKSKYFHYILTTTITKLTLGSNFTCAKPINVYI